MFVRLLALFARILQYLCCILKFPCPLSGNMFVCVRVLPKGMDLYMFSFRPASLPEGLFNKDSIWKGSLRSFGKVPGLCWVWGGRVLKFKLILVWTKSDKADTCVRIALFVRLLALCVRMLMLKFCCVACLLL